MMRKLHIASNFPAGRMQHFSRALRLGSRVVNSSTKMMRDPGCGGKCPLSVAEERVNLGLQAPLAEKIRLGVELLVADCCKRMPKPKSVSLGSRDAGDPTSFLSMFSGGHTGTPGRSRAHG